MQQAFEVRLQGEASARQALQARLEQYMLNAEQRMEEGGLGSGRDGSSSCGAAYIANLQ